MPILTNSSCSPVAISDDALAEEMTESSRTLYGIVMDESMSESMDETGNESIKAVILRRMAADIARDIDALEKINRSADVGNILRDVATARNIENMAKVHREVRSSLAYARTDRRVTIFVMAIIVGGLALMASTLIPKAPRISASATTDCVLKKP